jgi:hypothetical protein
MEFIKMNEKSWDILYEKYPDLFANIGIECNMGWYDIISSVCYRIKQHEKNKKSDYYPVTFDQIKEKWGGLRIYYIGGDNYIRGVIDMAEEMSYKICERCGKPGSPNKQGWIMTLCYECRGKNG